jgi:hypothetical protein
MMEDELEREEEKLKKKRKTEEYQCRKKEG